MVDDKEALLRLLNKKNVAVSRRTLAELKFLGVPLPENVKEASDIEPSVVVCLPYKLGEPLVMPDNKFGPCAGACGGLVQWRPHAPDVPKFCAPCIAEERQ